MGVKDLCQVDDRNKAFGISIEQLDKSLDEIQISPLVPESILDMTVLARKICLYSYFEYDLYSIFLIYLFLIVETAAKFRFLQEWPHKCIMTKKKESKVVNKDFQSVFDNLRKGWRIKGNKKVNGSLTSVLKWLNAQGIIPERIRIKDINAIRDLRNKSAHLMRKNIITPAIAMGIFWRLVDFVNCLFDSSMHDNEPVILREMRKQSERIRNIISEVKEGERMDKAK